MRTTCTFLFLLTLAAAFARADDTLILQDGTRVEGTITKEDNDTIFIQTKDGESRGIAKARIARVEKVRKLKPGEKIPEGFRPVEKGEGPGAAAKVPAPQAPQEKTSIVAMALLKDLQELGSPVPETRKAALAKAEAQKADAMPVLLAMLNPKFDSDEFTRIGVLRALYSLAPLPDNAAQTLAWTAVFEKFPEARREACLTIRKLADDRAVREVIRYSLSEDKGIRNAGAWALHEIDDNRVFLSLIRAMPSPSVTANMGEDNRGLGAPKYTLPVGPGGASMPIFAPEGNISGVAHDVGSPAADLMKLIAGKDLGSTAYSWLHWYREKTGDISGDDRDSYREKRSLRNRMNAE